MAEKPASIDFKSAAAANEEGRMKQANEINKNYMYKGLVVIHIIVIGLLGILIIASINSYLTKTIAYEGEMSCNSGLIDIGFNSVWDNQPYKDNITISTKCNENGCHKT